MISFSGKLCKVIQSKVNPCNKLILCQLKKMYSRSWRWTNLQFILENLKTLRLSIFRLKKIITAVSFYKHLLKFVWFVQTRKNSKIFKRKKLYSHECWNSPRTHGTVEILTNDKTIQELKRPSIFHEWQILVSKQKNDLAVCENMVVMFILEISKPLHSSLSLIFKSVSGKPCAHTKLLRQCEKIQWIKKNETLY